MKITSLIACGAASLLFAMSGSSAASDVIASVAKAGKQGMVIGLDLVSDGNVSGFDFKVNIPNLDSKSVRLDACTAELPKSFSGHCSVVGESVYVYVVGNRLDSVLKPGPVAIGKIYLNTVSGLSKKADGREVAVVEANISDVSGATVSGAAKTLSE